MKRIIIVSIILMFCCANIRLIAQNALLSYPLPGQQTMGKEAWIRIVQPDVKQPDIVKSL